MPTGLGPATHSCQTIAGIRAVIAPDAPVRRWLRADAPQSFDWSSRWRVVLEVLALEDRIAAALIAVRIVEQRAVVDALRAGILATDLPRPDTTATGAAFAEAYEDWVARVAVAVAA